MSLNVLIALDLWDSWLRLVTWTYITIYTEKKLM